MRNIEKICQWLGMVKPEQMRKGSRHEDLKGDTVALAKLVMKEGEKPGKFLVPHGIILLGWWLRIFMEDNPYGIQNQSSFRIMELSVYYLKEMLIRFMIKQAVEHLKPVLTQSAATLSRAGVTLSVDNSVMDRFGKLLRCTWSWYSGRCHDVVRGQDLLGIVFTINHIALPLH